MENLIWVFKGVNSQFLGGVFDNLEVVEKWIKENSLMGVLIKYLIN